MIDRYKNPIMVISFCFITAGFAFQVTGTDSMKDITFIIATILAGLPIALKAWQSLRMKAFSIELLVTIAVLGALCIKEYTETSIVTFLFLFGNFLEAHTLAKTRSSLKKLIEMSPQEAEVIRKGFNSIVSIEEVVKGDRVILRSGGKVPVDGEILFGHALVDETAVTGESVPIKKKVGDHVFSGTIVDNGYIEITAEKVGDQTTFAKIIELVEEAQNSKSKTGKFLDQFSTFYTPAVVFLSVLVFIITRDLHMAITFLVIACPGALVIGAPVSTVAGVGNGAKNGVIVKGGEIMEKLSAVNTLVFDKTGTLTKGKPGVTDIRSFQGIHEDELLTLAAEAELISEHHLGQTLVNEARVRKLNIKRPINGEIVEGKGIRAMVRECSLVIGNRKFMKDERIDVAAHVEDYATEREKEGNTAIFVAIDGQLAGIISIADQIREDAFWALEEMRHNGIERIIMLTGDNSHAAKLVAESLDLDEYHAELLPEDKVNFVRKLKADGQIVAMAGDGINDAPAIASADIGLAMGERGTDISIETADVVLMADKLMQFSHAYSLAKVTIRNMKQNTFFAVGIVAILLFGVLMGSVHLASGMFIHEGSVLLVIFNAMRLIRFKTGTTKERFQTVKASLSISK